MFIHASKVIQAVGTWALIICNALIVNKLQKCSEQGHPLFGEPGSGHINKRLTINALPCSFGAGLR